MDIRISPRKLSGTVTPPPSKSMAHRVILSAALSGGISRLENIALSQDIEATLRCMASMGTGVEYMDSDSFCIHGLGHSVPQAPGPLPHFDCGESGSTLRFLIPIALAVCGGGVFTGQGRLMERPQKPYFDIFDKQGISYHQENGTLTVEGRLSPGTFALPGNVSSQFVTGLLYALPLLDGDSVIQITSPLESRAYVDMTLDVLAQSGIQVENQNYERFAVPGNQAFRSGNLTVEADWSQAGFWYAANFLDSTLTINGLNPRSAQGDMVVADLYWKLARPGDVEIDISGYPDLLPPLAVMAAVRSGTTFFVNAARLRIKESDRLATVHQMLAALGGSAEEGADSLTVHGVSSLSGGTVDGANDHRIVMAAAVAATACRGDVTILGAQAVNKSYPTFWEDYKHLGGVIHVL